MKCDCGASLEETTTSEKYEIEGAVLEIADVPAYKCPSCHAYYFDDKVLDRIDDYWKLQPENNC